jgi:hypothetical protein
MKRSLKQTRYGLRVSHVDLLKAIVGELRNVSQTGGIGGVRQLVNVDELVVGMARHQKLEKVAADESGPAGYEDLHVMVRPDV